MNKKPEIKVVEYTVKFDTSGGSSVLGRLIRLLAFPFMFVFTGKAEL